MVTPYHMMTAYLYLSGWVCVVVKVADDVLVNDLVGNLVYIRLKRE